MEKTACVLLAILTILFFDIFVGCNDPDDAKFENAVTYSDFGAVGDGVTDDFEALKEAHTYANGNGVSVKAEKGKKYFIAPREDFIPVKTDVDWTDAEFITDDKSADDNSQVWWCSVFDLCSDAERVDVDIPDGMTVRQDKRNST